MEKNNLNSKNLRLFSEILGATLRFKLFLIFFFIILLASLDFVILSLIFQFINSLVNPTKISNLGILRALGTVNPTLILPIMALIVSLKSAAQYFLQLRINLMFSLRESFVSVTFFKATLMEDIEARKNRESVESLFLIDRYVSQIFGYVRGFPYLLSDIASAFVVVFGLIYYSPRVSLILIGIILSATILIFKVYSSKQKTLSLELLVVDRKVSTIKIESQKLATELVLGNRVDQTCEALEKTQLNSKNIMGKITAFGLIPKYLLEITLLLSLAFIFWFNHRPSFLSTLAIIAAAAFRVVPMIGSIVSNVINLRSGLVTLNRLSEIVSTLGDLDLNLESSRRIKPAKTLFSGDLRLQDVSFKYHSSNQRLFEKLNIDFADSTTTLLTGVSGAGKTTFLHLILGLLKPSHGEILLSGASGMHVMNDSIAGISFLQQGVALISGTVAENIVGSTLNGFSEEKIRKAIIDAGLESTVASLKDGFNTHVGEDANHFSAGERQRLGLARALYESPGLLILDEPTSNLDSETESEIWRTLATLRGKMTIIIVSHRGVPKDVYDRELIFTKQGNLTVISG